MYLPNLNALRFFAAILVLVFHIQNGLVEAGIFFFSDQSFLFKGDFAVAFFFVLSGFLLTYLAIQKEKQGLKFKILSFYKRRFIRIFPLYIVCVSISTILWFYIIPTYIPSREVIAIPWDRLWLFVILLPNLALHQIAGETGSFVVLWTIGVEEQFYLIFPLFMIVLLEKIRSNKIKLMCVVIIFIGYLYVYINMYDKASFISSLWFHYMFVGMFGAFLQEQVLIKKYLDKRIVQYSFIVCSLLLTFSPSIVNPLLQILIQSLCFIGLILCLGCSLKPVLNLEAKFLRYGGQISYGIYMIHPFVVYPFKFLLLKSLFFKEIVLWCPPLYYGLIFGVTFILAHYSFKYFESYFSKLTLR